MKIRIVDIAKKADVSVGTVDRFIHKRGKVSEKANEKIQQALKELGYEPDILARNLALKKEVNIVCLLPDPIESKYWKRPDFGIDKAIAELSSFKVNIRKIYFAPRIDSFKKTCDLIFENQVDGVVYVPMFVDESLEFSNILRSRDIPFIHINIHHPEAQPLAFIGQNPFAAGEVAARLCQMALGEKQGILIVNILEEKEESSQHHERIDGFKHFFNGEDNINSLINQLSLKVEKSEHKHEAVLVDFLRSHPEIRIIYVPNSRAYTIAKVLKKNLITDKLIIGFDTLEENVRYLKEGVIDILIGQQSKSQGYNAVMLMFNATFRKDNIQDTNYMPIDILNSSNIDFYEALLK